MLLCVCAAPAQIIVFRESDLCSRLTETKTTGLLLTLTLLQKNPKLFPPCFSSSHFFLSCPPTGFHLVSELRVGFHSSKFHSWFSSGSVFVFVEGLATVSKSLHAVA